MRKCEGYVWSQLEQRRTCECGLEAHGPDVPHECVDQVVCGGSWFGKDGQIDRVVAFPLIGTVLSRGGDDAS